MNSAQARQPGQAASNKVFSNKFLFVIIALFIATSFSAYAATGGTAADSKKLTASACKKLTLRDDSYAFKLRIRATSGYFQVNVGSGKTHGGCPDFRVDYINQRVIQGDSAQYPTLRSEACFVLGSGSKQDFTAEWDVVVPFVPDTGLDFKVGTSGLGIVDVSINDFSNKTWILRSFAKNGAFHAARDSLPPPGGLRSVIGPKPFLKPIMGAVNFPWFGTKSGHTGFDVHWPTTAPFLYTPLNGQYDSGDTGVIRQQMQWDREANLNFFLLSYWDQEYSNLNTAPFLDEAAAAGMEISVMIETASRRAGMTPRQAFLAQIKNIQSKYMAHPAWLTAEGKPILFFYDRIVEEFQAVSGNAWWDDFLWVKSQMDTNIILMFPITKPVTPAQIKVLGGGFSFAANSGASGPDATWQGAYQDDWNWIWKVSQGNGLCALPILPGFKRLRVPADAPNYRNQWRACRSSMPDIIFVNSWNEYFEATLIEPTKEFGTEYIRLTADEAALFCAGELGTVSDSANAAIREPGHSPAIKNHCGSLRFSIIGKRPRRIPLKTATDDVSNVTVFDLSGKAIKVIGVVNSSCQWDGRNSQGVDMHQGIYLVRFGNQSRAIFKF
jgi:hypothetical protein